MKEESASRSGRAPRLDDTPDDVYRPFAVVDRLCKSCGHIQPARQGMKCENCAEEWQWSVPVKAGAVSEQQHITAEQLAEVKDQCEAGLIATHDCPAVFALAAIYAELFADEQFER